MPTKVCPGLKLALTSVAQSPRFDCLNEALDHRQGNVGLKQCDAHLAQGVGDILLGESATAAQRRHRRTQPSGKLVKH